MGKYMGGMNGGTLITVLLVLAMLAVLGLAYIDLQNYEQTGDCGPFMRFLGVCTEDYHPAPADNWTIPLQFIVASW